MLESSSTDDTHNNNNDNNKQPKEVYAKYNDLECKFGISAYTTPHTPGFTAVLKARYSDFIVKEVDLDGNLAVLDSISIPVLPAPVIESEADLDNGGCGEEKGEGGWNDNDHDDEPVNKKLKVEVHADDNNKEGNKLCGFDAEEAEVELAKLVGSHHAKSTIDMLKFWNGIDVDDDDKTNEKSGVSKNCTMPLIDEKEKRKGLHLLIRSPLFAPFAVADTVEQKVRIWHKKFRKELPNFGKFAEDHGRGSGGNGKKKKRQEWPKGQKNYLRFVLYKENIDTGTAVKDISRTARLNPRQAPIGYAGMKDKRGITGQFCTVFRKNPIDIISVNRSGDGMKNCGGGSSSTHGRAVTRIGNFSYSDVDSKLGRLTGNRFDIALRNIYADSHGLPSNSKRDSFENTKSSLESIANAFKNAGFINYFGMQRFGKFHDTHEVGIAVLNDHFESAVQIILRQKSSESSEKVIEARNKWNARFDGVDKADEDSMRASESKCARSIVRAFGRFNSTEVSLMESLSRKPRDYRSAFFRISKNMKLMFLHAVQSYFWNKAASFRMKNGPTDKVMVGDLVLVEDKSESEGGSGTSGLKGKKVKVVQDGEEAMFSIIDVVLPLLGSKVEYPVNCVGSFIDEMLNEHNLSRETFGRTNRGELSLGGDYRGLLVKPSDVDWTIMQYEDPVEPLIQTDLMKLNGVQLSHVANNDTDSLVGMVVGFTLPPSSYATVALRELMKRPTDSEYQSSLKLEGRCESNIES